MKFDPTDLMDRLHAHRASLNAVIAETQQEINAAAQQPEEARLFATGTEREVIDDIQVRQIHGRNKYGTTVADNPLSLREWLQHAYEECLDQAVYLKRAIAEVDKVAPITSVTLGPVSFPQTAKDRERDRIEVSSVDYGTWVDPEGPFLRKGRPKVHVNLQVSKSSDGQVTVENVFENFPTAAAPDNLPTPSPILHFDRQERPSPPEIRRAPPSDLNDN